MIKSDKAAPKGLKTYIFFEKSRTQQEITFYFELLLFV
jgi:hypothetical protein